MQLRLLVDDPLDGPTNMARDEALLQRVGTGASSPTLRLYQWVEPTISLGYFQRYADYVALPPPAGNLPVVRRLTGGGAILHDLELTYSIALPVDHPLLTKGPNRLYELAHDAIIASLTDSARAPARCGVTDDSSAARGPFFCFARRHCLDVLLGAEKLAGSAQRRTRAAVLQHGSIVLGSRFPQQPAASLEGPVGVTIAELRREFPRCFAELTGCNLLTREWPIEEIRAADQLIPKYAGADWIRRA